MRCVAACCLSHVCSRITNVSQMCCGIRSPVVLKHDIHCLPQCLSKNTTQFFNTLISCMLHCQRLRCSQTVVCDLHLQVQYSCTAAAAGQQAAAATAATVRTWAREVPSLGFVPWPAAAWPGERSIGRSTSLRSWYLERSKRWLG